MKHLKLLILSVVLALCMVSSSADAILAGVNPDIRNDTGVIANDFHIEGKIKSGWPYMEWADPPVLVHHVDGIYPEFTYSIVPDSSSLWENEYTFTAHWKGADIFPGEVIHIGLVFDLYCNNLIIDLEGWWTRDGERISGGLHNGSVLIPGFDVRDTGIDPGNPDGGDILPRMIQIRNDSDVQVPGVVTGMDVAVVKEWMIAEYFQGNPNLLFDMLNNEMQGALPREIKWRAVPLEIIPQEFHVDSFFDVFFDIEIPDPDGTGEMMPLVPDFQQGDFLIDRVGVEYPGNDGVSSWRWTWHMHQSHRLDFGDAPVIDEPVGYPTLLVQNGARHIIQGPWFGDRTDRPDPEWDGQPESQALGDDNWDGNDDEDGIMIPPLTPGMGAVITIEVSNGGGMVAGWIDWNQDRQWSAAEQVVNMYLPTGVHPVPISVPAGIAIGQTFGRFRIVAATATGVGTVSPVGLARSGEVEDHIIKIVEPQPELDFGDAPDVGPTAAGYPTLLASNGARHYPGGPWLGPDDDNPDVELDGQPNAAATGDDIDGNDDEDGVVIPLLIAGQTAVVKFTVSGGGGIVEGWIDFNQNMMWEASEQVVGGSFSDGNHSVNIGVPASSVPGQSYARFRITANGIGSPEGEAVDGEVEDHRVDIEEPQPEYDWGDAPDNADGVAGYPTLMVNNGANHMIGGPWLGPDDDKPDVDADGQPTNSADGDDGDGNDDEDGVSIPILAASKAATIKFVVNGGGGYVTGWIDYDQSMSWELSELVVNGSYGDGVHTVTIDVPCDAAYGKTYARFRIVNTDILPITPTPEGPAPNGEVEDYILEIKDPCYWPLDADIDGDGKVDLVDFSIMSTQWLRGVVSP